MEIPNTDNIVLIPMKTPGENFRGLEPEFTIVEPENDNTIFTQDELAEILPRAKAIVAIIKVDSEMIAKALSLEVIVANGAGFDNIDVAAATALKIPVVNVPDSTAFSTAELALALMLDVIRKVSVNDRGLHKNIGDTGEFFRFGSNPGHNLFGKTLGIVGLGHIGLALAEFCWPLRMNIIYTGRHRKSLQTEKGIRYVPFDELIETSDIISINCPLNEESMNMFNTEVFMKMKPGAILINTARGKIVDQEAMIHFLENGKLAGAGLDVFPDEPRIPEKLQMMDNVVLTPHIGTNTVETRQAIADAACDAIRAVCIRDDLTGPIKGLVNPEILLK